MTTLPSWLEVGVHGIRPIGSLARLVLAWIAKCGTDHRVAITGATVQKAAAYSLREPARTRRLTSTTSSSP